MSEPAAPLLSRRAALIVGTVATGTAWITPLATSVSMTTAHAASGAPDSVKPPSQKGPSRGSHRPKAPGNNNSNPNANAPGHNSGKTNGKTNGNGNAKAPGSGRGNSKAPSRNYGDLRASGSNRAGMRGPNHGYPRASSHKYANLRASGSNRGGNGHNTQRLDHRKGSGNTQWFGRVWVWIKSCF